MTDGVCSIRVAGLSDADLLVSLEADAFGGKGWGARNVAQSFSEKGVFVLIADRNGFSVAFAIWRMLVDEAELLSIGVTPSARQRGIGTALMQRVMLEAEKIGAQSIFLEVDVANTAAIATYSNAGFVEIAKRKAYYRNGADALVMRRQLSSV